MSAYNRVIWSEGLFLAAAAFSAAGSLLRAIRRNPLPGADRAQLGFHRDRARARFSEHRQIRRCGAPRACFPTAPRSACPKTIRCRAPIDIGAARARSDRCISPCRCAARASPKSSAPPAADGLARHSVRELQARDRRRQRRATRRCSKSGALRTRCLLAQRRDRRRMRVSRWRMSSNAGPTSRSCSTTASSRRCCTAAPATRLATLTTELLGLVASAGRSAGRTRRGHRPRRVRRSSPIS